MGVFSSIFGSMDQKKLNKLDKMALKIEALEPEMAALSDGELKEKRASLSVGWRRERPWTILYTRPLPWLVRRRGGFWESSRSMCSL